jgi:nitrate reductase NapA
MLRRDFLRHSAMVAAAAVVARRTSGAPSPGEPSGPTTTPDGVRWDKAPCRFCGTGCHVRVGVKAGRVVAIQGDPAAEVNKGLLCMKGYHVGSILYGPDRLTVPQLRRQGRLEPISWAEAVDVIARRIMANPAGFAFYGSGQWTIPEGYAVQKLMKAGLGNNHLEPNARLCMASAVTGYLSVYGVDEPAGCYDDLDAADVIVLWGNNPAEMHPVLFSRIIDRRTRGETVTVIDLGTRRTRSTAFADRYLEFRPQSDLAIANGIAHLLLARGTWDREFVERHCHFRQDTDPVSLLGRPMSFEEYRAALAPYTPENVSRISGLAVADLHYLADLFGDRDRRICSLWCMGMNQHTRGTAINRLVHGLHLLSGHWGRPGDAPTSLTGQPSACGTVREVGTLCHALPGGLVVTNPEHRAECEDLWNVPRGRISPTPGYHTVQLWEKFCTPTAAGGDIHTVFVQVTNPGQSLPDLARTFRGKAGLEDKFLIVSDVYPTATTELADLVLPAALWVEKNGIYGNSERRTQQWFKQVEPPGQARPDAWMTIAVARRLFELGHPGLRDRDGGFLLSVRDDAGREVPAWDFDHYYDINVDRALYEEYRRFTFHKHKHVAPYDELVRARGLRWPVVEQPDGTFRETPFRFMEFSDPFVRRGAGVQFYHSVTKDDRALIWFNPYEPATEEPDADFPFWLCTGRVLEHWHTGSMTLRVPPLRGAMPNAYLEMHPEDAAALGFRQGEIVTLETRRGHLDLPVWLEGRGHPPRGTLFVPFFDPNLPINELTLGDYCPISKEPDYKKCAARVRRRALRSAAPAEAAPTVPVAPISA